MLSNTKSRIPGKNFLIVVFVTILTVQISAQDISFTQTGDKNINHFYVDLVSKAGTLNSDWALFGGMRAGYNINENISVGLIGLGLIPDKIDKAYVNWKGRDELHFGYGGVEASYKYNLSDKFYLTGMIMVGVGRADYEVLSGHDYFFIMEPGVSVNYRLADWFGLGYSIHHRLASGVKYAELSNASFGGSSMALDLKFGFNLY